MSWAVDYDDEECYDGSWCDRSGDYVRYERERRRDEGSDMSVAEFFRDVYGSSFGETDWDERNYGFSDSDRKALNRRWF